MKRLVLDAGPLMDIRLQRFELVQESAIVVSVIITQVSLNIMKMWF